MKIEVRKATSEDAEALVGLYVQSDPDRDSMPTTERVRASIQDNSSEQVFVASAADHLLGFATLQISHSCLYKLPTAELTDIYVSQAHRRNGIATQLLEAAVAASERENALELFLRVNHSNHGAIEFYKSCQLSPAKHLVFRMKYYGETRA